MNLTITLNNYFLLVFYFLTMSQGNETKLDAL